MKTRNNNVARQAIVTRYLAPTESKGARLVAECERGKCIIDYPTDAEGVGAHALAVGALLAKFRAEDAAQGYATAAEDGGWGSLSDWVAGGLPRRSKDAYCFVFAPAVEGGAK